MKRLLGNFLWWVLLLLAISCGKKIQPTPDPGPDPGPTPTPTPTPTAEAGWPSQYGGVMLQGFYWDSFADSQWAYLESQASDIAPYFSLIWVPNSGYCADGNNMGYMPYKYFDQNSSFGTESQLRSMIRAYRAKNTGIIADVVINHHNTSGWFDFPKESYKGTDYQFKSTDIVKNDDGGKAAAQASSQGVSLSANNDSGDDFEGCRDLDHKSANVQSIINAYLDYLGNDLGYAGFRYDMVKGYSASFTGMYNSKAKVKFSVGEYWDGNHSAVEKWISGTKRDDVIQSAAFDFSFRYSCRDASQGNWNKLASPTSATSADFARYAVTFVENHDTQVRSANEQQDPIRKDTLAVNAWLLANPGTPCVFYRHWQDCKRDIKLMIEARRLVGIHNQSSFADMGSTSSYAARTVDGTNGSLLVVCGPGCGSYKAPAGYKTLLEGYHYRYLVSDKCNTAGWDATVSRINEEEKEEPFEKKTVTIYVNADFAPVYFYIWDSNNDTQLNGNWPGRQITSTVEQHGRMWYQQIGRAHV